MTETIQTAASTTLTGVALHTFEEPAGLRVTSARVPATDMPEVRARVDDARAAALTLPPGEWVDVVVVWGRTLQPEKLTVRPADVESLRALLLKVNR